MTAALAACVQTDPTDAVRDRAAAIAIATQLCSIDKDTHWVARLRADGWHLWTPSGGMVAQIDPKSGKLITCAVIA